MDNNAHAVAWKLCGGAGKVSSDMCLAAKIILTTACDARASVICGIAAVERCLAAAIPGGIRLRAPIVAAMLFCQGRALDRPSKANATRKARAGHAATVCLLMQPQGSRHVDVSAACV